MKVAVLTTCFLSTLSGTAQIIYQNNGGSVTVTPVSIVSPIRTITPNGMIVSSSTYADAMDIIFQHVNRSPVSTGLLLDYGLQLTDVTRFNGALLSNNYTSRTVWQTLYGSLYSMIFNTTATLADPSNVNGAISSYISVGPGTTYIAMLHVDYEKFRIDAVNNNLVYISNNQIYDTPGRPSSPYEIKTAFAATPITKHTWMFLGRLSFYFDRGSCEVAQ